MAQEEPGKATRTGAPGTAPAFDVHAVRADFPILSRGMRGKPLTFLDSAASSQKPRVVIETLKSFYEASYANIHRGVYQLSAMATDAYERARATAARFINAADAREIVFVRNATEGINLVAASWGRTFMKEGDEVVLTAMEHHANIVPWQLLREQTGIRLKVVPMNERGELLLDEYRAALGPRAKLVAVSHVSNALGTVNPVREMTALAHERGIPVLLDGAQAVPHLPVDVQAIGCDFYVFSGHKAYGPTGSGVLWGRHELLKKMPPYMGGGDMIRHVTFEKTLFADPPHRFEAGTPDIAGAVGLGAALEYLENIGMEAVHRHGLELLDYGTRALAGLDGVRIIGTAAEKVSILSFAIEGIHPHDIGTILDGEGIAVRTGHHCAQPVMEFFGVPATTRASLSLYNTAEDIDRLVAGLAKVIEVFR